MLPIVLYGCETWCVTLREEHRLRVFENRVLRRIFGPKREEITEDWRKFHNKKLNDLHLLPTNTMVQISYWESNISAASQQIPRIISNPKVHDCVYNSPKLVHILC